MVFPPLTLVTVIGFQNTTLNTSEGGGGLCFNIAVLNGILGINVSINFTTNDNSAQGISYFIDCTTDFDNIDESFFFFLPFMHAAGLDYIATTSSLVLNNQTTSKSVYVGIIDDNIFERSEAFWGQLSATTVLPWNIRLEPNVTAATIFDHKRMYVGV